MRCHHPDHRLQTRPGKRERAGESRQHGHPPGAEDMSAPPAEFGDWQVVLPVTSFTGHQRIGEFNVHFQSNISGFGKSGSSAKTGAASSSCVENSAITAVQADEISRSTGFHRQGSVSHGESISSLSDPTQHLKTQQKLQLGWQLPACESCCIAMMATLMKKCSACWLACGMLPIRRRAQNQPAAPCLQPRRTIPRAEAMQLIETIWENSQVMDIPGLLGTNTVFHAAPGEVRDERFEKVAWTSLAAYHHCPHIETAFSFFHHMGSWEDGGTLKWQSHVELCVPHESKPMQVQGLPMDHRVDAYTSAVREGLMRAYQLGYLPANLCAARVAALEFHVVSWQRLRQEFRADRIDLQSTAVLPPDHELSDFWQQALNNASLVTCEDLRKCLEVKRQDHLVAKYSLQLSPVEPHQVQGRLPNSEKVGILRKFQASASHFLQNGSRIVITGPLTLSVMGARNWAIQWMMEALLQARLAVPDPDALTLVALDQASFTREVPGTLPAWCQFFS